VAGARSDPLVVAAVSPTARAQGVTGLPRRNEAAFTELYDRQSPVVRRFCSRWLRSHDEAEDAVQTVFFLAWRALERGVVPTFERAWLLSIAKNVCLSTTDARKRRSPESALDPHTLEEIAGCTLPTAEPPDPRLPAALAALTDNQRRAVVLRECHGLSYREIAAELELSQSAVETLIFRARRTLARQLRKTGTFLPWSKSLLGGATAKIAVGTTIAVVVATADLAPQSARRASHPVRPPISAPGTAVSEKREITTAPAATLTRRVVHTTRRPTAPAASVRAGAPQVRTPSTPATPSTAPSTAAPSASEPREPVAVRATTQPAATAVPQAPGSPPVTSVTQPVQAAVDTVQDTVASAAAATADTTGAVQTAVDNTTAAVTGTVQQTVSNVTSTVQLPMALPPPPKLRP
jgi:RNA polymerase sigma-70 factor, ECF subfamily